MSVVELLCFNSKKSISHGKLDPELILEVLANAAVIKPLFLFMVRMISSFSRTYYLAKTEVISKVNLCFFSAAVNVILGNTHNFCTSFQTERSIILIHVFSIAVIDVCVWYKGCQGVFKIIIYLFRNRTGYIVET